MFSASKKQGREDMLRNGCCFREKERRKKKEVSKKKKNEGKWGKEGFKMQNADRVMARGGPTGANYRFLWQPL